MYFSKSYLPPGYFPPDFFLVEAEELAGALHATLVGTGAVSQSNINALAGLIASLHGQGAVNSTAQLIAHLNATVHGSGSIPLARLLSDVLQHLTDFEKFINSAASQIREVVEVTKLPNGAHFVIDRAINNSQLDPRLELLSNTVHSRWPGYSFSWSNLGDRPYNVDRSSPFYIGRVPTYVGGPENKKQRREDGL